MFGDVRTSLYSLSIDQSDRQQKHLLLLLRSTKGKTLVWSDIIDTGTESEFYCGDADYWFGSDAPLEFSIGFYARLVILGYNELLVVYPECYVRLTEARRETTRITCTLLTAYFSLRPRLFLMTRRETT